jgi:hypothetical protein
VSIGEDIKTTRLSFKTVSNKSDNKILLGIISGRKKFQGKFLVLADGNRYGIEPVRIGAKTAHYKQYFLHYDSGREKLTPVFVRHVRITF